MLFQMSSNQNLQNVSVTTIKISSLINENNFHELEIYLKNVTIPQKEIKTCLLMLLHKFDKTDFLFYN